MSTPLTILCFAFSVLAMILFLIVAVRAIQRREVRRVGATFIKRPVMFVAVCCSYAMFSVIFLIFAIVFAKELIGKL